MPAEIGANTRLVRHLLPAIAIPIATLLLAGWAFWPKSGGPLNDLIRTTAVFPVIALLVLGTAAFVVGFIKSSVDSSVARSADADRNSFTSRALRERLEKLEQALASIEISRLGLQEPDRDELVASLRQGLGQTLVDELQAQFGQSVKEAEAIDSARSIYTRAHTRLWSEIADLRARSRLTLGVGIGATILAIIALTYFALFDVPKEPTGMDLAAHYVPRITLAIFIELFAFFFLRLYKATLSEMRSYQDKLTLMSQRQTAIEVAWPATAAESRLELAKQLLHGLGVSMDKAIDAPEVDTEALAEILKALGPLVTKASKSAASSD